MRILVGLSVVVILMIFDGIGNAEGKKGVIYGYLSADYTPLVVYANDQKINNQMPYRQDWDLDDRIIVGELDSGECAVVAVKYRDGVNGGWIKAHFVTGQKTDSSWKCKDGRTERNWYKKSFDVSSWPYASQQLHGGYFWGFAPSVNPDFFNAPTIYYINTNDNSTRHCRVEVCNTCTEDECFDCEVNNPCTSPADAGEYPHYDPYKVVSCSETAVCSEIEENPEIYGYFSANYEEIKVYLDGVEQTLTDAEYWYYSEKVHLGRPGVDQCVLFAVQFNETGNGGWTKATFSTGDQTGEHWRCSDTFEPGWEMPGFLDALWGAPSIIGGSEAWDWDYELQVFLDAPAIYYASHYDGFPEGYRYCRAQICQTPSVVEFDTI